ncbi:MAG: response regulator transcription factor [Gammaproteobacteria bacterium]
MPKKLVAIVEDQADVRDNYADALSRDGFKVRGYASGEQALAAFENKLPDLVIIDIHLGEEMDGLDLCAKLRSRSEILPIIILTAREGEINQAAGLSKGADDYVTKSTSIALLLLRIRALLRRTEAISSPQVDEIRVLNEGSLQLDIDRIHVHWKKKRVQLTLTEFWMVKLLASKPGQVFSRSQLMDAPINADPRWKSRDRNVVLSDETVTTQIKRLREQFTKVDPDFDAIKTEYGIGYRWDEGQTNVAAF